MSPAQIRALTATAFARLQDDQRSRSTARRANAQLEALARFCKIAGTVVAFVIVLAGILALDVAIWVPHLHP
jgi:hypothetical protein